MTEFNQLFDGGLAERVFFTFSIGFMLAYACGIRGAPPPAPPGADCVPGPP